MENSKNLARTVSLPLLVFYGLGTILGAGIYVLIGKVAGSAGLLAPLSFLLASFIAWITALSYSQLVILFPQSAGEAVYIEKAFNLRYLTLLIGLLIILTGVVSSATLANAFSGYLKILIPLTDNVALISLVIILSLIAMWGIAESLIIAALITLIEVAGLILIIYLNTDKFLLLPQNAYNLFVPISGAEVIGVISGAFLAFYAFIGFEDMVNIAEEVKEPKKVMPKAILIVIIASTALYVLIALIAVLSLPLSVLADNEAPLTLLIQNPFLIQVIAVIGVIAIVNGVLIQMIMAARVVYGMAKHYTNLPFLSYVHPATHTPIIATILVAILISAFALYFPLEKLAKLTSFIILVVFTCVNLALWKIKSKPDYKEQIILRQYPLLGTLLCIGLLVFQILPIA